MRTSLRDLAVMPTQELLAFYEDFVMACAEAYDSNDPLAFQLLPHDRRVANAFVGLAGEASETLDHWKKEFFHGKEMSEEDLVKEMGDVLWYFTLICVEKDMTLREIVLANIEKLSARFGDKINV